MKILDTQLPPLTDDELKEFYKRQNEYLKEVKRNGVFHQINNNQDEPTKTEVVADKKMIDFIQKSFEKHFEDKVTDIIITTNEKDFFRADIKGELMASTGLGGFKMYAKNWKNFDILKIEYNGVILTKEEKQELYNQVTS